MRYFKIVCLAVAICLFFTSCATFMPKVNAPDTGKEVQSYADPILRVNIWVPNYVTTLEILPTNKWIGYSETRGDLSEYYSKRELFYGDRYVMQCPCNNYEEYLKGKRLVHNHDYIMLEVMCEGPIVVQEKQYYDFEGGSLHKAKTEQFSIIDVDHLPIQEIKGTDHVSFTLFTHGWWDYERLPIDYKIGDGQFSQEFLNDLLETPIDRYREVYRTRYENTLYITATDFTTNTVRASATIHFVSHGDWELYLPDIDSSSPYFGMEDGKERQFYDDMGGNAEILLPYYEFEIIDYWQVVEEE